MQIRRVHVARLNDGVLRLPAVEVAAAVLGFGRSSPARSSAAANNGSASSRSALLAQFAFRLERPMPAKPSAAAICRSMAKGISARRRTFSMVRRARTWDPLIKRQRIRCRVDADGGRAPRDPLPRPRLYVQRRAARGFSYPFRHHSGTFDGPWTDQRALLGSFSLLGAIPGY